MREGNGNIFISGVEDSGQREILRELVLGSIIMFCHFLLTLQLVLNQAL